MHVHVYTRGHLFSLESDCLGCAVLLCFVVCLTLLASFFLPSHLSLTCLYTCIVQSVLYYIMYTHAHVSTCKCACTCI